MAEVITRKVTKKPKEKDMNRDPVTGAPGAHPFGTGAGAVSGGVAVRRSAWSVGRSAPRWVA
jgi:hypothetical protein